MPWIEYTALAVTTAIFIIGLLCSILPVIPANVVVWLGILIHWLWMSDASVSTQAILITAAITLFSLVADLLFGYWGARKFGASWKGAVGALIGACVGLFLPPPLLWLIVGPIIGAVVGELVAGRTWKEGSRAGFGTILGSIVAFAVKFGLSLCVIAIFYIDLFTQ